METTIVYWGIWVKAREFSFGYIIGVEGLVC